MEKGKKYLPIGSVVMLRNGKKRIMVTGFCLSGKEDTNRIWDYCGCMYPEGVINTEQTLLFDHEQIENVCYMGLEDDKEEKSFKKKLEDFMNVYYEKEKEINKDMVKQKK